MFGTQKLEITFGPWQDILLYIAVFLIIFVLGAAAVNMVIVEVKSWFGKSDPVEKTDERPMRYEVLWSKHLVLDGMDEQLRISSNIEKTTEALVQENGDGFVRYRPFVPELDFDWGMAMWRETPKLVLPKWDSEAAQFYADKDARLTMDIFKPRSDSLIDDPSTGSVHKDNFEETPDVEKPTYIIEWSNNEDFSLEMRGGIATSFLTIFPDIKILEIIESLGSGYIRYKLAEDDSEHPWIPNGYVTKDMVNAKHH